MRGRKREREGREVERERERGRKRKREKKREKDRKKIICLLFTKQNQRENEVNFPAKKGPGHSSAWEDQTVQSLITKSFPKGIPLLPNLAFSPKATVTLSHQTPHVIVRAYSDCAQ